MKIYTAFEFGVKVVNNIDSTYALSIDSTFSAIFLVLFAIFIIVYAIGIWRKQEPRKYKSNKGFTQITGGRVNNDVDGPDLHV